MKGFFLNFANNYLKRYGYEISKKSCHDLSFDSDSWLSGFRRRDLDSMAVEQRRPEFFELSSLHSRNVRSYLESNGIVVFTDTDFADVSITNVSSEIKSFIERIDQSTKADSVPTEDFLVNFGGKLKGYAELANANKTIVDIRGGFRSWDSGMIDIFNPHYLLPEFKKLLHFIENLKIENLLASLHSGKWKIQNTNIYVNRGVQNTRGMHVDNYGFNSYKVFVYLTDVSNLGDGPYCYSLGSNKKDGLFEYFNRELSLSLTGVSTDVFLFNPNSRAVPVFGTAGSIVISNQSGAHQGYPQAKNGYRIVAVFHYSKES